MKKEYENTDPSKIAELKAIYNDYQYMARQHEQLLQVTPRDDLIADAVDDLYPDGYNIPWQITTLNKDEK